MQAYRSLGMFFVEERMESQQNMQKESLFDSLVAVSVIVKHKCGIVNALCLFVFVEYSIVLVWFL